MLDILMGLTLHQQELVLSSKLVEDLYVYFCISDQVFSLDGRALVDYICTFFFFLVDLRPYQVIDLHTQLSYFKKVDTLLKRKIGEAQAKKLLSKAIYLFSIGSNDYLAPFTTNSSVLQSYSHEEYADMVIGNLTTVIKVITVNAELIHNLKQN
jgi:hypothetical protein